MDMLQSPSPFVVRSTTMSQGEFNQIYGGGLIIHLIMLPIYGSSLLQAYLYFMNYPNDSRVLKNLVILIMALGSTHAAFVCYTTYHYLVASYTHPEWLEVGVWSLYVNEVTVDCIVVLVHGFFIRMIYQLLSTRGRIYALVTAVVLILLTLTQLGIGIRITISLFKVWNIEETDALLFSSWVPLMIARVLADIIIAVVLCIVLYESRTGFQRSLKLVRTLIVYSLNRFVLTAVVVVAQSIALLVDSNNPALPLIEAIWIHLYIASFLATLNSRNRLRAIGASDTSGMSNDLAATSRQDRMDRPGVTSFNSTHKIAISRTVDIELSPVVPTRPFAQSNVDLEHKEKDTCAMIA